MKYILRMTLLSDTVFGNGASVPGGVDLSVLHDSAGFPYYKAGTFKGIFREELENYMQWNACRNPNLLQMLGSSGDEGADEEKLRFYDFVIPQRVKARACLANPQDVLDAFTYQRTFTALDENGMAKRGSLRICRCVRAGITFEGALECREEDRQDIEDVLGLIKWVGTMRNRGFGKVKIELA